MEETIGEREWLRVYLHCGYKEKNAMASNCSGFNTQVTHPKDIRLDVLHKQKNEKIKLIKSTCARASLYNRIVGMRTVHSNNGDGTNLFQYIGIANNNRHFPLCQ